MRRFLSGSLLLVIPGGLLVASSACAGGGSSTVTPGPTPTIGSGQPTRAELPMKVMVSLPLFADFVREIGGDNVEVSSILPSGADPHTYEPTPSDIERMSEADFFFVNGLGLEGNLPDIIEANRKEDAKVIPFAPNIRSPRGPELGDPEITADEAGDNPHLWLDPLAGQVYAAIVADTFVIYDGVHEGFYNTNLATYSDRIFELNQEIQAKIDGIPQEKRKLVTTHDAFSHLARRYGLELVGFAVPGPGQDPSPQDIAELTRAIQEKGVPAVFREPQIGPESRVLEQIAADADVEVCTLYSDSLDDRVGSYLELMRFNTDELVRCLGGEAAG